MSAPASRRSFLTGAAAFLAAGSAAPAAFAQIAGGRAPAAPAPGAAAKLRIAKRTLEVNGKPATVFSLLGPDGRHGLTLTEGDQFRVELVNATDEPTIIHWHGLNAPWTHDGVGDKPAPLLAPGSARDYDFPVGSAGTHWMHAHTLQEQNLLAAPLIVRPRKPADEQEVVVLLHDFSFATPEEILARLKKTAEGGASGGGRRMAAGHGMMGMMGMGGTMMMDRHDVEYDAYLANDRTLDDPEVVTVERKGRARLRIINGATATAFTIDTGPLEATLVAVDGQDVKPIAGRRFPIAMGQRLDLVVDFRNVSEAVPILALREGERERAGIILAPPGARVAKLGPVGDAEGSGFDYGLEARLRTAAPLPERPIDRRIDTLLSGSMAGYAWSQSGFATEVRVRRGERVAIAMQNHSHMAHPMHLHGHRFQVLALDGRPVAGAVRDTVNIRPMGMATVAFDADNPGVFAFHCHNLYHMAAGMMGFVAYENV